MTAFSRTQRIAFAASLVVALLFGVIVTLAPPWHAQPDRPDPGAPPMRPDRTAELSAFLDGLRTDAEAKGVSRELFERATKGLAPDDAIADLNASQPEHVKTAGDYVGLLVSDTRLAAGRAKLIEHDDLLKRIEARFGVDRHVVLAIWGIESAFGTSMGERNVIRSLTTLAVTDQRRSAFWKGELLAAMTIVQRGDTSMEGMLGSWAGAMGHTQFMPSTFLQHAVDFDGDGRRDIWGAPPDALASAASYLKASGWVTGQSATIEVQLPESFDFALSAPNVAKTGADWTALGLRPARSDVTLSPTATWSLSVPAGHLGPVFLTGQNFKAILKYNRAVPYALAVSHLAERLAGAGPFVKAWPPSDKALSRGDREDLQTRLAALGHDIGGIDGIIGTATRTAIRAFQRAERLPEDGHPDQGLLDRLRRVAGKSQP
jgi:membrane-bound lytic murein transglycosylase B